MVGELSFFCMLLQDAFSLGEEEEKKMGHLDLAGGTNSPQFSINISHSPESSPEPEHRGPKYGIETLHYAPACMSISQ